MINWVMTEKLYSAQSESDIFAVVEDWGNRLGFEEFGFAVNCVNRLGMTSTDKVRTFYTYDSEWADTYKHLKKPEVANQDSRVRCSVLGLPAGAWQKDGKTSYTPILEKFIPGAKAQLRKAGDHGLQSGITVPLQSRRSEWGFFSYSKHQIAKICDLEQHVFELTHISQAAFSAVEKLLFNKNQIQSLSSREKEVLLWAAIGKTSWEISVILKISERTVNFHIGEAARKLGVRGRRAACTAAMMQGLIHFV